MMSTFLQSLKQYYPKSTRHWVVLILLFTIGLITLFTRLWNIPGTLEFLGDQGRDALLVRRIFIDLDPVFIGPVTSVGNMYLGPLYYYFMVPFLALSYPSPVGPAYAVAILSILTTAGIVYVGYRFSNITTGLLAGALFALHAVVIQYSRFSWNPNPAPFIMLLMVFWTYLAWTKSHRYWLLVVAAFSALIQLHYIALLAAAGAGVIFLMQCIERLQFKKSLQKSMQLLYMIPLGLIIFIASLTPLILFDIKHDGVNIKAFQNLFIVEKTFTDTTSTSFGALILKRSQAIIDKSEYILATLQFGTNSYSLLITILFVFTIMSIVIVTILKYQLFNTFLVTFVNGSNKPYFKKFVNYSHQLIKQVPSLSKAESISFIYLFTGIIGVSFYKGSLFNHYISYLFPVICLAWALIFNRWISVHKLLSIPVLVLILIFAQYNISAWNFETTGWSMYDMQRTANRVVEQLDSDEPYILILLTGTGDLHAMNYRYFLTTLGYPPLEGEFLGDAQKIIIINENQPDFDPTQSEIYELVVFPFSDKINRFAVENEPEIILLERNTSIHSAPTTEE